ncbi:MAG: alcohol dehydrogenase catalytic domain-containing protein [Propionicimonas sp.]
MRAGYYVGNRTYEVRDIPVPVPQGNEVLIEVAWCGLCATDLHKFDGLSGASKVVPPVILGHECSGIVVDTGPDCTAFAVGDRVACNPSYFCGVCDRCRVGKPHFCRSRHGVAKGLSEYVSTPQQNVHHVSAALDLQDAAFAEPLSCALRGVDLLAAQPGANIALYGLGGVGSLMLQLLLQSGAASVTVVEREPRKRELALALGANRAVTDSEIEKIATQVNFDYVVECIGRQSTMEQALDIAGLGAKVMLFGLGDPASPVRLNQYAAYTKELSILTSYLNPGTTERAVRLLESGRLDTRSLVSAELSLDEVGEELATPRHIKEGKVMVRLSGKH